MLYVSTMNTYYFYYMPYINITRLIKVNDSINSACRRESCPDSSQKTADN